ncbi:MAG TPA: outer membrane beta-barrel protein [Puia sp.]|jgi:outer membrane receptor protein involved in Fe transport|nr:outer membrane beta-barrel protein [Puia sp.]
MPKLIACILFCVLFTSAGVLLPHIAFGQTAQVSGKIADTAEKKNLANSSILLLRKTDSMMIRHARSDGAGDFRLSKLPGGHYLILVTYPGYADYIDTLDVDSAAKVVLPPIPMVLKSKLLESVVISARKGAMHIKGDTTEFVADSFKVHAGATVEDLLKRLPGIQVDRNGQITAEGQTVKKVLVDGEEFFGDDPTLVTQNLRADMVDKVQVYDKKSDQANFTGIDDGVRDKTINLKLKDNKKNGYFGRVTASAGTDGYYDEELMANYFRKKEKLSVYGILSNTGKTGLNWQDRDTYGQSFASNLDVDDNTGAVTFNGIGNNDDLDDWNGQYSGQGFPTVKTGGLHFNNKWNDDALSLNGNYKYMDLSMHGNSATSSENILPDTVYYTNSSQKFNREIIRQNFSAIYEWKFDSTSSIKFSADGGNDHKVNNELDSSQAIASDSSLVNQNVRTVNTVGDNRGYNSNLLWRKKLGKPGRTVSLNVRENYSDNTSSGYLYSNTAFYSGGVLVQDSLVNQYKNYLTKNILLDSRLVYTEPIGKQIFLGIDYGATLNNTHSDRNSYNKDGNGKYDALDSLYSNNYQYNIFTQRAGLAYTMIRKKFRLTAANDIAFSSYRQKDLVADTSARRDFINWYPNATLNYQFAAQTRLFVRYSGNTTPPTLQQLQPIASNENPLNVIIGNPGLKPQFQNRFNIGYNSYHILTERSIYGNISYSFTANAIGSSLNVNDTTGKQTTQSVNVSGNHMWNGWFGYGFKIKGPDMNMNINVSFNQGNNVTIVNNVNNLTKSGNYTGGLSFWKSKEKKYEFYLNANLTYTTSESSIDPMLTTHYYTYQIDPGADVFLPWHMQVHADANLNIRQKTPVFTTNNNVFLVNGWIGKKLLKNDQLMFKASVNDLLNQNNGFNRNVSSSFITQNTYSTIKRYFLFSVVWNFTKAGIPVPGRGN